jgi:predicted transcriptional regulator
VAHTGCVHKSLRRHLSTRGLTPEQYREKWGLPRDYPMVAPNYAKQRSELAKALGLGQLRRNRAAGSEPPAQIESTPEPAKKARGRRKRTAEAA